MYHRQFNVNQQQMDKVSMTFGHINTRRYKRIEWNRICTVQIRPTHTFKIDLQRLSLTLPYHYNNQSMI